MKALNDGVRPNKKFKITIAPLYVRIQKALLKAAPTEQRA